MIVFREKATNRLYTIEYVMNRVEKAKAEYAKDGNLFEEYLGTEFSLTHLFENPLTEEQQNQVKEDFEDWCKNLVEDTILSKYEKVYVLGEE